MPLPAVLLAAADAGNMGAMLSVAEIMEDRGQMGKAMEMRKKAGRAGHQVRAEGGGGKGAGMCGAGRAGRAREGREDGASWKAEVHHIHVGFLSLPPQWGRAHPSTAPLPSIPLTLTSPYMLSSLPPSLPPSPPPPPSPSLPPVESVPAGRGAVPR